MRDVRVPRPNIVRTCVCVSHGAGYIYWNYFNEHLVEFHGMQFVTFSSRFYPDSVSFVRLLFKYSFDKARSFGCAFIDASTLHLIYTVIISRYYAWRADSRAYPRMFLYKMIIRTISRSSLLIGGSTQCGRTVGMRGMFSVVKTARGRDSTISRSFLPREEYGERMPMHPNECRFAARY